MNPRDIVKLAFQFREPVATPFTLWFDKAYEPKLDAYFGGPSWKERVPRYTSILTGFDMLMRKGGLEHLPDGTVRDPFGAIWRPADAPVMVKPALEEPTLDGFCFPDVNPYYDEWIQPRWPEEITDSEQSYRMGRHVAGLFERAWFLRGYENLLMDLVDNPGFCHALLDACCEWLISSIDRLLDAPVDAIILTEDYADQRGMVFGLERYREFFIQRWRRVFDHIHRAGVLVVLHVCGNAEPALPDLIEIGLDCLESVQPEAIDPYHAKREYGSELRFWGGIGVQKLMPFGTPEEIRAEVLRAREELGRGGGFILNTAKPIADPIPVENAAAYIDAAME